MTQFAVYKYISVKNAECNYQVEDAGSREVLVQQYKQWNEIMRRSECPSLLAVGDSISIYSSSSPDARLVASTATITHVGGNVEANYDGGSWSGTGVAGVIEIQSIVVAEPRNDVPIAQNQTVAERAGDPTFIRPAPRQTSRSHFDASPSPKRRCVGLPPSPPRPAERYFERPPSPSPTPSLPNSAKKSRDHHDEFERKTGWVTDGGKSSDVGIQTSPPKGNNETSSLEKVEIGVTVKWLKGSRFKGFPFGTQGTVIGFYPHGHTKNKCKYRCAVWEVRVGKKKFQIDTRKKSWKYVQVVD